MAEQGEEQPAVGGPASTAHGASGAGFVRAATAMAGASALIAITSLLAKALGRGVEGAALHPLQISAGRFFFALIALSLASVWLQPDLTRPAWGLHVARTLFGWLAVTCMFAAAARMPLAEATAITFLSPLATMALAIPFLRERVGPMRWLAAGISVAGALILIRPGFAAFQPAALIAFAAALCIGIEAIFIKHLSGSEPPMRILLINNAIGSAIALVAVQYVWLPPTAAQWAMLIMLGVIMACSQSLLIFAMRTADAGYVIPFFYLTLIFAALYDLALFGDRPDLVGQIGMVIIVVGALLLVLRGRRT